VEGGGRSPFVEGGRCRLSVGEVPFVKRGGAVCREGGAVCREGGAVCREGKPFAICRGREEADRREGRPFVQGGGGLLREGAVGRGREEAVCGGREEAVRRLGRQLLWRGRRRVSLTGKKSQVEDSLSGQPHPPRRLLHRPQAVALRNDTVTIFSIYTRNMWMRGRAYILLYLQIAQRNLRQQLSSHVHVCTSRKRSESRANNRGCGHVRRIHNKKREKACYTDGK
jgi:hypothetical protein